MLHLVQLRTEAGAPALAAIGDDGTRLVEGVTRTRDLALAALAAGESLAAHLARHRRGAAVDLAQALAEGRIEAPISHPDPAHMLVTGTGLSHLGSAEGRDKMHRDLADPAKLTDSMRMFRLGLEGGKPAPGTAGVQPEWFYKGDGSIVVGPEAPLCSPEFALDAGEEPEIAGVYLIGSDGTPWRLGFTLANEFSDHVTERQNYLYLAHSKLRQCSLGAELLTGALPADLQGTSRVRRNGAVLWERPFLSGEANMCHSIANLEAHHFKYARFRRPWDIHIHFFGTATLSFSDGVRVEPGDIFEIEAPPFTLALCNPLSLVRESGPTVREL